MGMHKGMHGSSQLRRLALHAASRTVLALRSWPADTLKGIASGLATQVPACRSVVADGKLQSEMPHRRGASRPVSRRDAEIVFMNSISLHSRRGMCLMKRSCTGPQHFAQQQLPGQLPAILQPAAAFDASLQQH